MKTSFSLFPVVVLCGFLLGGCKQKITEHEDYVRVRDTTFTDAYKLKGKVSYTFKGADGVPYYFDMSDTVPTFTWANIPHVMFSQGDPVNLHSILVLNNLTNIGNDSLNAILAVVDGRGNTNNAFKATPSKIGIQTCLVNDSSGGAYYGFTKDGIDLRRGEGSYFGPDFFLTNHKGLAGQVLTLNPTGDTAEWANPAVSSLVTQKYFAPLNGQAVGIAKYAYNIINPNAPLQSLSINLPASPADNDWFEVTFTQPVKKVNYTGGKVANNAIKSATLNNYYKKFVFRKADLTWY